MRNSDQTRFVELLCETENIFKVICNESFENKIIEILKEVWQDKKDECFELAKKLGLD